MEEASLPFDLYLTSEGFRKYEMNGFNFSQALARDNKYQLVEVDS